MNRIIFSCLILFIIGCESCSAGSNPKVPFSTGAAKEILNQPYGKDPQQRMDIYLPKGRTTLSKVFILIHGGGWHSGDKSDMSAMVAFFRTNFPHHAIVNINYRLATTKRIGFPRQIEDLQQVISYLDSKGTEYHLLSNYAMIGSSAGGHLAMLYGYKYNSENKVKSVCSIVGPTDFSDPEYKNHIIFNVGLKSFVGNYPSYTANPKLFNKVSPAKYVTATAPATLLIYSANDPLVPATQGQLLHEKLNAKMVYNEYYKYENAYHANWSREQQSDIDEKMKTFFTKHF